MKTLTALQAYEGVREDGGSFRPSDWIERLSTVVATFGPDHRLRYANGVQPRMINGRKCLVVSQSLRRENPSVYEFVLHFARTNHLRIREEPATTQEPSSSCANM